jgi:mannose-6-phosphate isomerase-like protein (cupin superfamily)
MTGSTGKPASRQRSRPHFCNVKKGEEFVARRGIWYTLYRMKNAAIIKQSPTEFFISENCYITERYNHADDADVSVAQARVKPGVTTRWHRLKEIEERYVILSGEGRVEVGDLPPENVSAGDSVLIPPMCRQRITNTGDDDLIFLAVCTPRFDPDAYEDLESC